MVDNFYAYVVGYKFSYSITKCLIRQEKIPFFKIKHKNKQNLSLLMNILQEKWR